MKVRALAALLLVAFPAVAIAQGRVPGVTDTEIVIGLTAPLSGPAAIYGNRLSGLCRRGGLPRHLFGDQAGRPEAGRLLPE
jgi:hypothetical protein